MRIKDKEEASHEIKSAKIIKIRTWLHTNHQQMCSTKVLYGKSFPCCHLNTACYCNNAMEDSGSLEQLVMKSDICWSLAEYIKV